MIEPRRAQDARLVAGHYDELDAFYRELWGEHVHHGLWSTGRETPDQAVRRLVDEVAAAGAIGAGSRVCDIGCGYGATCRQLAERGARTSGLTISRAQCDYARAARSPSPSRAPLPTYELRDWLDNGLADGDFDAAVAIESLSHMPDKRAAFAECARILHPGGRLVICDWLAAERPRAREVRWLLEPICREGRLPSMGTESEYRGLLAEAGLHVTSARELTAQVSRTWSICLRRVALRLASDPQARRYLRDATHGERAFLRTMARIPLAYRTGAMRYVLLVAAKPS